MPPVRRPLAGLAAIGAAALIAGCGGGSDSSGADDFRAQADEICADANERIDGLTAPGPPAEVLPYLRAGLPIQAEELERIRALDPPEDLQADFDEATDLLQQRQDAIQQAADRIEAGEDPEAVIRDVGPEITRLRDEARVKADELGLTVCGAGDDATATATAATTPTAPATTAATTSAGAATAAGGETARYVQDVGAAVAALRSFSQLLQGTGSLEDLQARIPQARGELDAFDEAVRKLGDYSFDNATLEAQRDQLAASGPQVSEQPRRFLAAAEQGDAEAIQAVLPDVTQALTDFQEAATP
jgi:hypothetical protein